MFLPFISSLYVFLYFPQASTVASSKKLDMFASSKLDRPLDAGQEEEDDDQFFRPKHRSGGDSEGLDNDALNALDGTKVRLQSSSSGVESVYRMVFCGSLFWVNDTVLRVIFGVKYNIQTVALIKFECLY